MPRVFQPRVCSHGFSLVELILVVAILGTLGSIAITSLGGWQHAHFKRVRDRRNAQEIASITMGATAAGAQVIQANDLRGTIQNLLDGTVATHGTFSGRTFRLSALTEEEIAGAVQHLVLADNMIEYVGVAH